MKIHYILPIVFLAFCGMFPSSALLAQNSDIPDPTLIKPPHIILQTGVSSQWLGGEIWRSALLSLEHPIGRYQHIGVEANFVFPDFKSAQNFTYYSYERYLDKGSYEVGLFYKIFLHGRLTGRRSNLYVAPELKFGRRNFKQYYYNDISPFPATPPELRFYERTSKFALRLGAQYRIGPAILEIALPIAVESFKTINNASLNYNYYNYNNPRTRLLFLPSLQFGIAF